jgi:hypothetical protein
VRLIKIDFLQSFSAENHPSYPTNIMAFYTSESYRQNKKCSMMCLAERDDGKVCGNQVKTAPVQSCSNPAHKAQLMILWRNQEYGILSQRQKILLLTRVANIEKIVETRRYMIQWVRLNTNE